MFGAGLAAAWLVALVVIGVVAGDGKGEAIAGRLGESLHADATLDDSDLALIRGRLVVGGLRVRRDGPTGTLALDVGALRCELPPLGLALVDSACRELALDGLVLDVSTFDVLRVPRPRRAPIDAGAVAIDGAVLRVPVGPGRGEIQLTARAGATTLKTPVSWVLALEQLRATLVLPLGRYELFYAPGLLVVSGGGLGAGLVLPVAPPAPIEGEDGRTELARLAAWGRGVAMQVMRAQVRRMVGDVAPRLPSR